VITRMPLCVIRYVACITGFPYISQANCETLLIPYYGL